MIGNLSKNILDYCVEHSAEDSPLLKELSAYTFAEVEHSSMLSGSQVGNLLQALLLSINAKKVLDVGTFTGYSALKMAEVLPTDGIVQTFEADLVHAKIADSFFKRSENRSKICLIEGPALDTLRKLENATFDFAFIDADKENYPNYYRECKRLIRKKGIIVFDNILWGGEVLNPQDDETNAICETAGIIQKDDEVFNFILPVRDGLMICIKRI